MLRRLYDWTFSLAETNYALAALALVAFLESSVFAIPPDVLLIPMVLANPKKAWVYAAVCTICSVLGGAFGYFIGAQLFQTVGQPILDFYGKGEAYETFRDSFNAQGVWAVLFAGVTPFPYKVITITSGATGLHFAAFMGFSLLARGIRFFLVAALLWKFGEPVRMFIEKRLGILFTLFMILLIGGFFLVKYL